MTATASTLRPYRPRRQTDLWPALLLSAPALVLLLVFLLGPFVAGVSYSFTNQRLISGNSTEFVGLRNYQRLLTVKVLTLNPELDSATGQPARDERGKLTYPRSRGYTRDQEKYPQYYGLREWFSFRWGQQQKVVLAGDPVFMTSLRNNLFFSLVVIPLQTMLGLLLAILVNQQLKGRNIFRTIYFSPVVTSMVVVSIVWRFLYDLNHGMVNQFLANFAIGPVDWLGNPKVAMWSIIIMSIWQGAGMQMVLFLAGLQNIPDQLYEASSIDGAGPWQQFRFITLPSLRNTIIFIFITITIAAFQLFTQVFVMTGGGPADSTSTVMFHMVRTGFREQDLAYASTIAVVFLLIILAINFVQRRLTREA